jgi:hypothetical protein
MWHQRWSETLLFGISVSNNAHAASKNFIEISNVSDTTDIIISSLADLAGAAKKVSFKKSEVSDSLDAKITLTHTIIRLNFTVPVLLKGHYI